MSLDGTFLHCVVSEMLSAGLVGGRIDKIYQPSREEIIISIRSAGKHNKILISSNSMSARVCMTERAAENPSAPPMFCMLLRKHLSGGKLLDITQDGLERIINFDFECMNEIGDMVVNRLTAEIMGRHSNIILMAKKDGVYRVTDSIKRITDDVSSGKTYTSEYRIRNATERSDPCKLPYLFRQRVYKRCKTGRGKTAVKAPDRLS